MNLLHDVFIVNRLQQPVTEVEAHISHSKVVCNSKKI